MIHKIKTGIIIVTGMFSSLLFAHPSNYCKLTNDLSCERATEKRIENSAYILPLLQKIDRVNEQITLIQMRMVRLQTQRSFINDTKCAPSDLVGDAPPCPLSSSEREYIIGLERREALIRQELNAKKQEKNTLWEELFLLYPSYQRALSRRN